METKVLVTKDRKKTTKKPLRIGILIDSFETVAWVRVMLEQISKADYAKIELVIKKVRSTKKDNRSLIKKVSSKIKRKCENFLFEAYTKHDHKRYKVQPDAFAYADSSKLLSDVPVIEVETRETKYCDYIEKDDIEKIKKYDIDVLIRLGFRILKGEILNCARYGVWSYHHGDNRTYRGGPAGFWEVFNNNPVTGSILQILTEDLDNGKILYRSYSRTNPYSVRQNRNNLYWKSLSFIGRKLKELYESGEYEFFKRIDEKNKEICFYTGKIYKNPKYGEMIMPCLRLYLRNKLKAISSRFYKEQWTILYNLNKKGISTSLRKFKRLTPPEGAFWADPFVIQEDNKYYIFFEESFYEQDKGHICLLEVDGEGRFGRPVTILERPYHISFPFVFRWDNNFYMIPESNKNNSIELYRCTNFPDKWKFEKYIMKNVNAWDSVMFFYNGKWWLFTNIVENEGASGTEELYLFYSDRPTSDKWQSHPNNPIVSDVRSARMAGKILENNGAIYRPSQDCSYRYGYGIKINKVKKLSETEYEETEISRIEPKWARDILGIHTFNNEGALTVSDVLIRQKNIP